MDNESTQSLSIVDLEKRIVDLEKRLKDSEINGAERSEYPEDRVQFKRDGETRNPYFVSVKEFLSLKDFIVEVLEKYERTVRFFVRISYLGETIKSYDSERVFREGKHRRSDLIELSLEFSTPLADVSITFRPITTSRPRILQMPPASYRITSENRQAMEILDDRIRRFLNEITEKFRQIEFSDIESLKLISNENIVPLPVEVIKEFDSSIQVPSNTVSQPPAEEGKGEKRTFSQDGDITCPTFITPEKVLILTNRLEQLALQFVKNAEIRMSVNFVDGGSFNLANKSKICDLKNGGDEKVESLRLSFNNYYFSEREDLDITVRLNFGDKKPYRVYAYSSQSTLRHVSVLLEKELTAFSQENRQKYPKLAAASTSGISYGITTFFWIILLVTTWVFLYKWKPFITSQLGETTWSLIFSFGAPSLSALPSFLIHRFLEKRLFPKLQSLYPYSVFYLGEMVKKYDQIIEKRKKFYKEFLNIIKIILISGIILPFIGYLFKNIW